MIPFASQRGGGQDLATHLQNAYDNELTEVVELRGAIASDLHGAFKEWEVQAETLTRCQKYLYSLSINPDPAQGEITRAQYSDYIRRAEEALGLTGQPRAVVFHIKHGREHCHVVWSRIDAERGKAVHIAFDRDKLMQVTRSFAKEHFLDLPAGYDKSRKIGQETLYERAKQSQTGLSKSDHARQITDAWIESDSAKAFVNALAERGYILARGKRPYVVVDFYGDSHALARLIDDKTVKTRDVRAFLEKDFPEDSLPTVAEAQDLIASYRKTSERNLQEERIAAPLAALKHAQKLRRLALDQERIALERRHGQARGSLIAQQRDERHVQRRSHLGRMSTLRQQRSELRVHGLAGFLGRVTGVSAIRRAVHRYRDRKILEEQKVQRVALQAKQLAEKKDLAEHQALQSRTLDRKLRSLTKVEDRELAALKRDGLKNQRVQEREGYEAMPPLDIARSKVADKPLGPEFEAAKERGAQPPPDPVRDFNQAASAREPERRDDGGRAKAPENGPERER